MPLDNVLGRADVFGAVDGVVVEVTTDDSGSDTIRFTAPQALTDLSTGRYSSPSVGVAWSTESWPAAARCLGFAFTQFALPVVAGRDLGFEFDAAHGVRSPRVVSPLIVDTGEATVLIAPTNGFHELVIAIGDGEIRCGLHGDLDQVPAGFEAAFGVYQGASVTEVLAAWRSNLTIATRTRESPLLTHLSYWTDNGAAYWYRTEPEHTIGESVIDVVQQLRASGVPVNAVELDSWFYQHEVPRQIAQVGYPDEVPPSGALEWSPRRDAFPTSWSDPIRRMHEMLDAPLVLHARHLSPQAVDDADQWWVDQLAAQPTDPTWFRRWFDDARRWGATCIEQDWMLMFWFAVRELRSTAGRAAHWQRTLDELAGETDIDLLWCMATPADLMLAAQLDNVIAVRTSDDYRFAEDPALLWTWFLVGNRLANTLGLAAFKDCFFSSADVDEHSDAIDGDAHAELEALLSALSAGPVGLGDRIGRTDVDVVMRTCDADGRLRRVDHALAAVDECVFGAPAAGDRLMWATTSATIDGVVAVRYIVAINTSADRRTIADTFDLGELSTVDEWRTGAASQRSSIDVELATRDWAMFVVREPEAAPLATVGDVSKYVVIEADGSSAAR